MRNFFLTKEEFSKFDEAYTHNRIQSCKISQSGNSTTLKDVLTQKSGANQSREFKSELTHQGIYLQAESNVNSALCSQEAAAILQSSSISWNILEFARAKGEDEPPAVLKHIKRTALFKAGRKAGFTKADGAGKLFLQAGLGIAGILIAATLATKGFYSAPMTFQWNMLLVRAGNPVFILLAALLIGLGIGLGNLLWRAIQSRDSKLMSQLYSQLLEKSNDESKAEVVEFLCNKLLEKPMPLAVICEDVSSIDPLSRKVLDAMLSARQPTGKVVWVVFDLSGSKTQEGALKHASAKAFAEHCSTYLLTRGTVFQ